MEMGPGKRVSVTRRVGEVAGEGEEESWIKQLFGGKLCSTIQRRGGGVGGHGAKDSATVEPFLSLHLDISEDGVYTIEDALELLCREEELEVVHASGGGGGGNGTSGAGTGRRVMKRTAIEHLPPVLILHLKRFVYDPLEGTIKLRKHIHYPNHLSISPRLMKVRTVGKAPSLPSKEYELTAGKLTFIWKRKR